MVVKIPPDLDCIHEFISDAVDVKYPGDYTVPMVVQKNEVEVEEAQLLCN